MVAELARQEKGGAAAHAHANCLNGEEARAMVRVGVEARCGWPPGQSRERRRKGTRLLQESRTGNGRRLMNMEGNRRFLSPREIEVREGIGVARRAQRPGREGHGLQFFFRTADSTGARRFFGLPRFLSST